MSQTCPHCGLQLPQFTDAFCLECRNPLDESPAVDQPAPAVTSPPASLDWIAGAEGMTAEELGAELDRGGRLVVYQYCVSVLLLTFLRSSKVHLVRAGESAVAKGLGYTLLSLLVGWWGFPWGFVYTPAAILTNLRGGKDVTAALLDYFPAG